MEKLGILSLSFKQRTRFQFLVLLDGIITKIPGLPKSFTISSGRLHKFVKRLPHLGYSHLNFIQVTIVKNWTPNCVTTVPEHGQFRNVKENNTNHTDTYQKTVNTCLYFLFNIRQALLPGSKNVAILIRMTCQPGIYENRTVSSVISLIETYFLLMDSYFLFIVLYHCLLHKFAKRYTELYNYGYHE